MSLWEILILALLALLFIIAAFALVFWLRNGLRDVLREIRGELRGGFYQLSRGLSSVRGISPVYDEQLSSIIARAERESGVRLTSAARQMLALPILETIDLGERVDWDEVNSSIRDIVKTRVDEDDSSEIRRFGERLRTCVAVVKGFHVNFCNIPPFCSRPDRDRDLQ